MAEALLLTSSDFQPLRTDLSSIAGAIEAVENAVIAQRNDSIRQQNIVDRVPGEFEGIRVSLSAGDDLLSGMRVFGNPPHTRAFLLFDGTTRALMAVMDYGVLNSMRVGAIAGLAAKYLAPAGARRMGLIGSGWQAPPQVAAMRAAVPNLERIRVYSPTPEHRESFAASMSAALEMPVEPVASTQEALEDADVVDLCAPGHFDLREPLFEPAWIKPGALVVSMGANQCPEAFVRDARVVTGWQSLITPAPRAPYDHLIESGALTRDDVTELGSVIVDGVNPRTSSEQAAIYQLEGGTAHDLFVAIWGYHWAKERGLGHPFDLSA